MSTLVAALLGARVLYRAHAGHHTVTQVHATDEDGKKLYGEEEYERDGDKAKVKRAVPVMRTVSEGSVHHDAMREFVGFVGRVRTETDEKSPNHGKTVCDIELLIPNRERKWVDGVVEGTGDHEFTVIEGDEVDHEALAGGVKALEERLAKCETAIADLTKPAA